MKWFLKYLRYSDLDRAVWHTQWPTMDYKYSINKSYITSFLYRRKTFLSFPFHPTQSWANIYYGQCKEIVLSTSTILGTYHNNDAIQDVRLNLMWHSKESSSENCCTFNCFARVLIMTLVEESNTFFFLFVSVCSK